MIPYDKPVKLFVASSFFQLADAAGAALSKTGAAIPVTVPSGQQPPVVKLKVTGGGR